MAHGPKRRLLPVLAVAGTVGFLSLLFAAAPFDPGANPHASFRDPSSCPACHPVVRGRTDPDRLLPGAAEFCFRCHSKESLGRSHPVGTRPRDKYPRMKVPLEFRLDDEGRMTCVTCHAAHGAFVSTAKAYPNQEPVNPGASPGTALYYKTRFLRRTDPVKGYAVLCDGCHERL